MLSAIIDIGGDDTPEVRSFEFLPPFAMLEESTIEIAEREDFKLLVLI